MGAPAKFLFDVDFSTPSLARERATPAEMAAKIAAAEARAYREGYDAAQTEMAQRSAAALEQIASTMRVIADGFSGVQARMEIEAVEIGVAASRKLCTELVAREPLAEIEALIRDCFAHLVSTPHLVVRISDTLYDTAREAIEAIGRQSGFAGRLVILAEPEIAGGDCKIEWADGGIVRDRGAVEVRINELVGRYVAARHSAAAAAGEGHSR